MSNEIININTIANLTAVNCYDRIWGLSLDVKNGIKNINDEAEADYYQHIAALPWKDVVDYIVTDGGWKRTSVSWKSDKGGDKKPYWHINKTNVKWDFAKYVEYSMIKSNRLKATAVLTRMHVLCSALHMGEVDMKNAAKMWHSLCQEMSEVTGIPLTQYNLNRKSVIRELSARILRFTDDEAKMQSLTSFCKDFSIFIRRSIKNKTDETLNMSGEYSKLYREMVHNVKTLGGEPTNMLTKIDTEATA